MESDGGEEINCSSGGGMADQVAVFEKRHGELVEEAGALVAESGAGITVVAVSPRSGEPRVSVFPAGGGGCPAGKNLAGEMLKKKQAEVTGMDAAEFMAFEGQLRALNGRVLQRVREEKEKAGGRPAKKLAWEAIRKQEEAVGMDAAEVPAFEERVRRVHQRISGAEKAGHPGKKLAGEIGNKKQQEVAGMDAEQVMALEDRMVRVLKRMKGAKEQEKAGRPGKKLAGEIRKKQEEVADMDAAEVVAFQEQLQALRVRVLRQIKEKEEEEKAAGAAPMED